MIKDGYYLKARCIQDSDIAHTAPCIREIWDWLLKEANYKDTGTCKRGQCIRSYKDIQEGLSWYIGWRKMTYKKHDCENTVKWLKRTAMITTKKTTRGMVITVINYDKYQTPENYENHTTTNTKATRKPQTTDTINKKEKNVKNEKKLEKRNIKKKEIRPSDVQTSPSAISLSVEKQSSRADQKKEKEITQDPGHKEKAEIIEILRNINPTLGYNRKTYYTSIGKLFEVYGKEMTKVMAQYAISIQGKKYAPVVTTPTDLLEKASKIIIFKKNEDSGDGSGISEKTIESIKTSLEDNKAKRESEK